MHLPLASLMLHALVSYLVGFVLFFLGMFPVMGFGLGIRAVLQRLGWATSAVGDDPWQIVFDFTLAAIGGLLIAWLIHRFRRQLWQLISRDFRLLRLIGRVVVRPFAGLRSTRPPDGE